MYECILYSDKPLNVIHIKAEFILKLRAVSLGSALTLKAGSKVAEMV
jgi:hypothetical protein